MEIQSSRLTLQPTQEGGVQPNTASVARLETGVGAKPASSSEASHSAVETLLHTHSTPVSREETLHRMLTEFLTSLLQELDEITDSTLLDAASLIENIREEKEKHLFENEKGEVRIPSRSQHRSSLPSSLPSTSLTSTPTFTPTATSSELPRGAPVEKEETLPQENSGKALTSPYSGGARLTQIGAKTERASSGDTSTSQSFTSNTSVTKNSQSSSSLTDSKGDSTLLNSERESKVLRGTHRAEERVLNKLERNKEAPAEKSGGKSDASIRPLLENNLISIKAKTDSDTSLFTQPRTSLKIDSAILSTYRDLIRTLLSQPGGVTNQLESGVAKALVAALSNETTSQLLEVLYGSESVARRDTPHNMAIIRDTNSRVSSFFESIKKGEDTLPRSEIGLPQNRQKAIVMSGDESFGKVPLRSPATEVALQPPNNNASLGITLKNFAGAHNLHPRIQVGVLSDPALLAALQGAVLKRTYSDVPKMKKKTSRGRGLNERSREKEDTQNDTSQESIGLSLLRAFLEKRSEQCRR